MIRILALSAIATAASSAQQVDTATANARRGAAAAAIVGVWDVAVTVVDCTSGALIRNVHSVQMHQPDGAFSETTNTGTRGSSLGYWRQQEGLVYETNSFFRYNPDGSFASFAKAANAITLSSDNRQLSVTATIKDYDANNNLLSTGCVTQTAKRDCELSREGLAGETSDTGRAFDGAVSAAFAVLQPVIRRDHLSVLSMRPTEGAIDGEGIVLTCLRPTRSTAPHV